MHLPRDHVKTLIAIPPAPQSYDIAGGQLHQKRSWI